MGHYYDDVKELVSLDQIIRGTLAWAGRVSRKLEPGERGSFLHDGHNMYRTRWGKGVADLTEIVEKVRRQSREEGEDGNPSTDTIVGAMCRVLNDYENITLSPESTYPRMLTFHHGNPVKSFLRYHLLRITDDVVS